MNFLNTVIDRIQYANDDKKPTRGTLGKPNKYYFDEKIGKWVNPDESGASNSSNSVPPPTVPLPPGVPAPPGPPSGKMPIPGAPPPSGAPPLPTGNFPPRQPPGPNTVAAPTDPFAPPQRSIPTFSTPAGLPGGPPGPMGMPAPPTGGRANRNNADVLRERKAMLEERKKQATAKAPGGPFGGPPGGGFGMPPFGAPFGAPPSFPPPPSTGPAVQDVVEEKEDTVEDGNSAEQQNSLEAENNNLSSTVDINSLPHTSNEIEQHQVQPEIPLATADLANPVPNTLQLSPPPPSVSPFSTGAGAKPSSLPPPPNNPFAPPPFGASPFGASPSSIPSSNNKTLSESNPPLAPQRAKRGGAPPSLPGMPSASPFGVPPAASGFAIQPATTAPISNPVLESNFSDSGIPTVVHKDEHDTDEKKNDIAPGHQHGDDDDMDKKHDEDDKDEHEPAVHHQSITQALPVTKSPKSSNHAPPPPIPSSPHHSLLSNRSARLPVASPPFPAQFSSHTAANHQSNPETVHQIDPSPRTVSSSKADSVNHRSYHTPHNASEGFAKAISVLRDAQESMETSISLKQQNDELKEHRRQLSTMKFAKLMSNVSKKNKYALEKRVMTNKSEFDFINTPKNNNNRQLLLSSSHNNNNSGFRIGSPEGSLSPPHVNY